jgi:hypothetical protein
MTQLNSSSKGTVLSDILQKNISVFSHLVNASQNYLSAFSKYSNDFIIPYLIATSYFNTVEKQKLWSTSPLENVQSYMELLAFNLELISRSVSNYSFGENGDGKRHCRRVQYPFLF